MDPAVNLTELSSSVEEWAVVPTNIRRMGHHLVFMDCVSYQEGTAPDFDSELLSVIFASNTLESHAFESIPLFSIGDNIKVTGTVKLDKRNHRELRVTNYELIRSNSDKKMPTKKRMKLVCSFLLIFFIRKIPHSDGILYYLVFSSSFLAPLVFFLFLF